MTLELPLWRQLTRLTLGEWAASVGTTPRHLLAWLGAGAALAASVLILVAHTFVTIDEFESGLFSIPIACTVIAAAGAFGALDGWLSANLGSSLRAVLVLPISARHWGIVARLPATIISAALTVAVLPALVLIVAAGSDGDWPQSSAIALASLALGSSLGRLAAQAIRTVLAARLSPAPILLITCAAWMAFNAAGWALTNWVFEHQPLGIDPVHLQAPFGWPLVLDAMVAPTPSAYARLCGLLVIARVAGRRLERRTRWHVDLAPRRARVRRHVHFDRHRWESSILIRTLRNARGREAILLAHAVALLSSVLVVRSASQVAQFGGVEGSLVIVATTWGGLAAQGRSLSPRAQPIEHLLGASPGRHVVAVVVAMSLIATPVTLLACVPAAVLSSPGARLPVLIALATVTSLATGTALGFTVVSDLGNVSSTFLVMLTAFFVNNVSVGLLASTTLPLASALAVGITVASLTFATNRESRRRAAHYGGVQRASTTEGTTP